MSKKDRSPEARRALTPDELRERKVVVTMRVPISWKRRLEIAGGLTALAIPLIAKAIRGQAPIGPLLAGEDN